MIPSQRIVIFCDGDFWHGRNWNKRRRTLASGSNARYWIAKIESNMQRDARLRRRLRREGWSVIRVWESDIHRDIGKVVERIARFIERKER